jgi:hypothetical protein
VLTLGLIAGLYPRRNTLEELNEESVANREGPRTQRCQPPSKFCDPTAVRIEDRHVELRVGVS